MPICAPMKRSTDNSTASERGDVPVLGGQANSCRHLISWHQPGTIANFQHCNAKVHIGGSQSWGFAINQLHPSTPTANIYEARKEPLMKRNIWNPLDGNLRYTMSTWWQRCYYNTYLQVQYFKLDIQHNQNDKKKQDVDDPNNAVSAECCFLL